MRCFSVKALFSLDIVLLFLSIINYPAEENCGVLRNNDGAIQQQ
jgi:hypothetical protein